MIRKVLSTSALATGGKVLSAFLTAKIIGVTLGPIGLGVLSQYLSLLGIFRLMGNGGTGSGVTKYIAEHKDEEYVTTVYSTSFITCLLLSILSGGTLFIFAETFSEFLFESAEYKSIIRISGVTIFFVTFQSLFNSVLNGHKLYKSFSFVTSFQGYLLLVLYFVFIKFLGVEGALYAVVFSNVILCFVLIYISLKRTDFRFSLIRADKFDGSLLKNLIHFSVLGIFTPFTHQIYQVAVRKVLVIQYNLEAAGIWQGMLKLSEIYLQFVLIFLASYYFPRVAETKNNIKLVKSELKQTLMTITPVLLAGFLLIYFLRGWIIELVYSSEFASLYDCFSYQLLGDYFKIVCLVLSSLLLAHSKVNTLIFLELLKCGVLVVLSYFLGGAYGVRGVCIAHFFAYVTLTGITVFCCVRMFKSKHNLQAVPTG